MHDKENSASLPFLVGSASKRACFHDPRTPMMRLLSSNQGFDFTAGNSANGVRSNQFVSQTTSKRPAHVAVTPPSHLLSSFTKNVPLLSKNVSQSQCDDKNPTASDGLDSSMNCYLDCVLDSQIFGLVDELKKRKGNDTAPEDHELVSRPNDGFVPAAQLLSSPVRSREAPPAGANTCHLVESVIAAAGGNNTHSVHGFRSGDSLRFGHSKLIRGSTPVEGVAAAGQHRRRVTGTIASYSTLSGRPCEDLSDIPVANHESRAKHRDNHGCLDSKLHC